MYGVCKSPDSDCRALGVNKQLFLFSKYQQIDFSDATEADVNATIECADSPGLNLSIDVD